MLIVSRTFQSTSFFTIPFRVFVYLSNIVLISYLPNLSLSFFLSSRDRRPHVSLAACKKNVCLPSVFLSFRICLLPFSVSYFFETGDHQEFWVRPRAFSFVAPVRGRWSVLPAVRISPDGPSVILILRTKI